MLTRLVRETAIYGGGDFLMKFVAFFTFPILAGALTLTEFGTLELITTVIGLASYFVRCGINNATQRFYWDSASGNERPLIVTTGIMTLTALGAAVFGLGLVCIIFFGLLFSFEGKVIGVIAMLSALTLVVVPQIQQFILDALRLQFSPWKFLGFSLASRLLGVVVGLIAVVYLSKGIEGFLFAQAAVACAVLPIGIYLIKQDLIPKFSYRWCTRMLSYGYPFIFVEIAFWIFTSMDRWMLAAMVGVEETAIYGVAFRFSSVVMFISAAFGMAWSPYAVKLKTDFPDRYKSYYADLLVSILIVFVLIAGAVALYSGEIVALMMKDSYHASAIPLAILCFGVAIQTTQQITAVGISLEQQTHLFARIAWLAAAINLVANAILIPAIGASGAAVGSVVAYLVLTLLYAYFSQKLHPIPLNYKRIGWIAVLASLIFMVALIWNSAEWNWALLGMKCMAIIVFVILAFPSVKNSIEWLTDNKTVSGL